MKVKVGISRSKKKCFSRHPGGDDFHDCILGGGCGSNVFIFIYIYYIISIYIYVAYRLGKLPNVPNSTASPGSQGRSLMHKQ